MPPSAISLFTRVSGLVLFLIKFAVSAQSLNAGAETEIYVKIKPEAIRFLANAPNSLVNVNNELPTLQNTLQKFGYTQALRPFYFSKSEKLQQIYRIKIADSTLVEKFVAELGKNVSVEYAEKIPVMKMQYLQTPNDPELNKLWHLQKTQAFEAFEIAPFKTIIPIAVVDGFMQFNHPDLLANMSFCQDIANADWDVSPPSSIAAHGTHVSGIIGATTNNNIGIASIGFNRLKLVGLNSQTNAEIPRAASYTLESIAQAIELGFIRVINMSFGSYMFNNTQNEVIQEAHRAGIILVAAAGNENTSALMYPASYDNVISVASTNVLDTKSGFSNFGSFIDIAAPGENIYSTLPNNSYSYLSGTSMACPLVAGAIGFILSIKPEMNGTTISNLIKNTADDITAMNSDYKLTLGYGRLNLKKAVECLNTHSSNSHFSINGNNTEGYCNSQTYLLQVPTEAQGSAYQWYKDGETLAGATSSTLSISTSGTYLVTVTTNNCPRKSALLSINFSNCPN